MSDSKSWVCAKLSSTSDASLFGPLLMHVINAISCRLSFEAVKIMFKQDAESAASK